MKGETAKNTSRLITLIIYLFLNMPGQIVWVWEKRGGAFWESGLFWIHALVVSFIGLEFLELKIWSYRYKNPWIPRGGFLLRAALLAAAVVLGDFDMHGLVAAPYVGLLLFYAYFCFSPRVGFFLCVGLCTFILIRTGILLLSGAKETWREVLKVSYRLPVVLITYHFARNWVLERNALDDNRTLIADLNRKERELRETMEKIGRTAALEERTRLARDIHDSVGHSLMALQIQINKAVAYAEVDRRESDKAMHDAGTITSDAIRDIRSSLDLLNRDDPFFSLQDALPRLLSPLYNQNIAVNRQMDGREEGYNHMALMGIYRLVQEGVTNILKHAEASRVDLSIYLGDYYASVLLQDDGKGMVPQSIREFREGHFGLAGLERRMELAGGSLEIRSFPGEGTCLKAKLPKNSHNLSEEEPHGE